MSQVNTKERPLVRDHTQSPFKRVSKNDSFSYLFTKRLLDIIGAIFGIIILSPLYLLVGVLIKVEDFKGPIFFSQTRVGRNGEVFKMYKFRSMVANAEELKAKLIERNEATGPVFKIKEDPRITKVGRFIRKTSIDELPQLFNVLKGDMSLVGPRPPLPEEVNQYNNYEKQRLTVTPGLTCYWQVSGRSNISFQEWIRLDLKYIEERNVIVDIKLIVKTVLVLFGSKDAY
ncbi:multidrug MFS transporter [Thalassobacillus devorans]|uniref:Multidrug MFS transporter n=1 Tax=Thalassobacillus devorans TaxID=279813 RepID=A0ABQ1NUH1_9BACI|nr:sugar transferase [Thalassobacillus devorans]NIK28598.1 lipopolysaccharide/colanic/teichoic acid biosynthesis glycosyltransferase [Thalassobacillus devorans]GGC84988.1 multidrug MFS transporter [Thalassobacillus devorans]